MEERHPRTGPDGICYHRRPEVRLRHDQRTFGALMSLVGFAGTATINAAQSQMLIAIFHIIGNIIAWGGIGVLLIFYKLDKIYPRIITEMKQREAAEAAKATANA